MTTPAYLDYAATTPVDPRVAELMARHLTLDGIFANPASRSHMLGWQAEQAVENARRQVADLINADPREIVWTSGATEADNLALTGYLRANRARGRHLVTSTVEHKAVVDTALALEAEGFEVTWLTPGRDGRITPEQLRDAMRQDTVLVSLMAVNNELGVIHDLAALAEVAHAGGALYVKRHPDIRLEALIHGGGHERGMRSGTLPTHQIVGMGEAFALAGAESEADQARITALRDRLLAGLADLGGIYRNTAVEVSVPNILNLAFEGVDGESLLMALRDVALSTGSACNSASVEPSYVLKGIGLPRALALASLRFSFGRFTTEADIDMALAALRHALTGLRRQAVRSAQ